MFSVPSIRAQQASENIGHIAKAELAALKQLSETECSSAPRLLDYCQMKQTDDMIVPQGYILYILMNRLPGVPLGDIFWQLDAAERQDIRGAFKIAYEYVSSFKKHYSIYIKSGGRECLDCGIITLVRSRENSN